MLKILRCRSVISVSFLVFCFVAGCASQEAVSRSPVSGWLVSPELLEDGKLEILWQHKLPIKERESLERLFIVGDSVYGLSDQNYMVSLNRENGDVIFSRSVAPAGVPVVGLELYNDEVFSIAGNRLVEISPESGIERRGKRLAFGVTCPAARNSSYFYVAGADRRMRTLRAEDKVKVFEVAAENESVITSIVADEDFVVFATAAGNVVSITPDRPKRLWQFDAAGAIVGPIVKDADSLFFASEDTSVYKVDIRTGKLDWKCQTAAVLDAAPRVTQEVVYQYVCDKGLLAIDKKSGNALWQLTEGVGLLAEADGKAHVITKTGALVAMDNKKATQLYSVDFVGVSRYVANVTDSKIYIADVSGRIACLKPVD